MKAVDEGKGWKDVPPPPNPYQAVPVQARDDAGRSTTACGWRSTAPAPRAARASTGRDVAGKTGTAQVISLQGRERARGSDKDLRDHGWFVFMVPRDNPELAGVVFAEHSEHGYLAAPIAKHIIETYYAEKEGRPLPTLSSMPRAGPGRAAAGDAAAVAAAAADTSCRRAGARPRRHADRCADAPCSNGASTSTSTGLLDRRDRRAVRDRPGDDLQHHRRARRGVYWTQIYALGARLIAHGRGARRSTTDRSPTSRTSSTSALIAALVAVMLFGSKQMGAQRWIDLGFFNLQPSEFAKATLALVLAKLLGDSRRQALTQQRALHRASC